MEFLTLESYYSRINGPQEDTREQKKQRPFLSIFYIKGNLVEFQTNNMLAS